VQACYARGDRPRYFPIAANPAAVSVLFNAASSVVRRTLDRELARVAVTSGDRLVRMARLTAATDLYRNQSLSLQQAAPVVGYRCYGNFLRDAKLLLGVHPYQLKLLRPPQLIVKIVNQIERNGESSVAHHVVVAESKDTGTPIGPT